MGAERVLGSHLCACPSQERCRGVGPANLSLQRQKPGSGRMSHLPEVSPLDTFSSGLYPGGSNKSLGGCWAPTVTRPTSAQYALGLSHVWRAPVLGEEAIFVDRHQLLQKCQDQSEQPEPSRHKGRCESQVLGSRTGSPAGGSPDSRMVCGNLRAPPQPGKRPKGKTLLSAAGVPCWVSPAVGAGATGKGGSTQGEDLGGLAFTSSYTTCRSSTVKSPP